MKTFLQHIIFVVLACSCSKSPSSPEAPAQPEQPELPSTPLRVVQVSNSQQLKEALLDAKPGDDIQLADAVYKGKFVIGAHVDGSAQHPIRLSGSRHAILDAESIQTGYVLHLQANYWHIKGISLTNGLKGLMTDGASFNIVDSISVFQIGDEAIHLRRFSSHNTIQKVEVRDIGLKTPDYGEAIYIGSAKSNWSTYTNGLPDKCDSNIVQANKLRPGVTAECIDIKEGTTGGIIRENHFDATGITGANSGDSWIDVKGNNYLIENNNGYNPGGAIFKDGYQVHVALNGWGNNNAFRGNTCTVNATGYGFNIQLSGSNGTTTGNKVYQNNTVTGAVSGVSNIGLTP